MKSETYYTKAIILSRQVYRENDSKVLMYTLENGMLELVARGTGKKTSKLASHIEPITLSDVMVIRGRNHDYVGTSSAENCFRKLKEDYEKIVVAGEVIAGFNQIIKKNEVDENIFFLVLNFLHFLNDAELGSNELIILKIVFEIKFLKLLGYLPSFSRCSRCDERDISKLKYFNNQEGGVVCSKCVLAANEENVIIDEDLINNIKFLTKCNFDEILKIDISPKIIAKINNIVGSFKKYQFE